MLNAKEARKKVEESKSMNVDQERAIIEERINEAIKDQKTECWLYMNISYKAQNWLSSLGYSVIRFDYNTKVLW